ncbi:MAG: cobalamin B12-binding domain-containing protein [Bacillota bacterium]
MIPRKVLLAPIDPVHDVGIKMIRRGIEEAGHETVLLQPDLTPEEIIREILKHRVDVVLLSRSLGYGVAEILARFVDLADAVGIRQRVRLGIGGMAIRPELAAELGFDAGFGPGTTVEEAIAFVEGREYLPSVARENKPKRDITSGYTYAYRNGAISGLLTQITDMIMSWAANKTSPGVLRAQVREELWDIDRWRGYEKMTEFLEEYPKLCGDLPRNFYEKGIMHPKTRRFVRDEVVALEKYIRETRERIVVPRIQHTLERPLILNQYGTGCPFMDTGHIKVSEAWGADGVIHFDPSWGARTEGFLDGFLTHQEDGTVITPANLNRIKNSLEPGTLWQVRAHRGLNTPETVVLAGKFKADLTKINICYGSLAAGTDPARLTVDAVSAIGYAAAYGLHFDVVTNEELSGVPAYKAFAGMLITVDLALRLGAKPVLQPLFCYSPEVMLEGYMKDNYVDFNVAKIHALRSIIDSPVWPGAPIGFLTHTEDRIQSSASTSYHASMAAMLGVDAITIASSDEAYSGGPISVPSKVDTLRAVAEGFRFFGNTRIDASAQALSWSHNIVEGIESVLKQVVDRGDFVEAIYDGILGSRDEGVYPGRNGRDTVMEK